MLRKKRFSGISLLAAWLSAASNVQAAEHPVYPAMPYQTNQNFYNIPNQPIPNQNFYPNIPQQFPAQQPILSPQPMINQGYPYQNQMVNPPAPTQPYSNLPSQFPPYNNQPMVYPNATNPVANPQMTASIPNNKPAANTSVQPQQKSDPNLKPGSSNAALQNTTNQLTKPSNANKNSTLKMKKNSSILNKIISSSKNAPLKTIAGLFLGAIFGGFSDKTFSGKSAVIGAVAGAGAGALCDHFTGDLSKSIKAIKEIWKDSNKTTDNKVNNPALLPQIPIKAPINQNMPIIPAPQTSTPSTAKSKTFVMDEELQKKVDELHDLQNKYIRLMYVIKYSDSSGLNKKTLFSKLSKIEETCLVTGPAVKFMSECSSCLYDIRNSQFKSNTTTNFKEQSKIINNYLSHIPTLYTRKDLSDLIPRVKKCLSKLIEFKCNQIKATQPTNNTNENNKTSNTDKSENNEKKIDRKATSGKTGASKVVSDKSVEAKKSIV